jgi:hypothetical protein
MAPYLTRSEVLLRLEAYGLDAGATDVVTEPDVLAASDDLDAQGPFVGDLADEEQEREFPRDDDETPPDAVLNWVALRAYELAKNIPPPVTSSSVGSASSTYASPRVSHVQRRMAGLLDPYISTTGSRGYPARIYPPAVPRPGRYPWRAV